MKKIYKAFFTFLITILLLFIITGCNNTSKPKWIEYLQYSENEVYTLKVSQYNEPMIPVRINDKEFYLTFDTGIVEDWF